jgi:hypothetical protein
VATVDAGLHCDTLADGSKRGDDLLAGQPDERVGAEELGTSRSNVIWCELVGSLSGSGAGGNSSGWSPVTRDRGTIMLRKRSQSPSAASRTDRSRAGPARRGAERSAGPDGWWEQLDSLDLAVHLAVAATTTPTLDRVFRRLSRAADHSRLWLATAAVLATVGGARAAAPQPRAGPPSPSPRRLSTCCSSRSAAATGPTAPHTTSRSPAT